MAHKRIQQNKANRMHILVALSHALLYDSKCKLHQHIAYPKDLRKAFFSHQ